MRCRRFTKRCAVSILGSKPTFKIRSSCDIIVGGESPVSLLPSNSSSLGHLDVVGDKLEEVCIWILALVELDDVVVEGDIDVREVGWRRYGFLVEV